jgi:hypothetical protein
MNTITSITQAVYLTLSKTTKISQSYRTHKALGRVNKKAPKQVAISAFFRKLNTETTNYNRSACRKPVIVSPSTTSLASVLKGGLKSKAEAK